MEYPRIASHWYGDRRFSHFWQHYNTLMSAAHQDALARAGRVATHTKGILTDMQNDVYRCPRDKTELLHQSSHSSTNPFKDNKHSRKRCKRQRKKRRKKKQNLKMQENQSDTEILFSQMKQGMNIQDDNEDMDVSEDFLVFIEQSKKHREAWKFVKSQDLNTAQDITDGQPKEHPDVTRRREMHQLYGQASPKLQAMETALQLTFERNAMLYQSQYWPNIPLNVMFN
ncbi:Gem-associated protein 8 [Chionoecetes opilio]|uniref:Gem-associated protein 8 n=1 Tax=Chionoecetes opilio TaxID=41210 RepID=A0A8J4YUP8_CHIOP|nr:Gem-associated protein 8 [Chionoecetes opilio]